MYINLQPGQESLLTFKLRLDKGTFDNVTSNKWDNLLKKDVHWKDILRHDIYVNNRNPTKNPNTDKLLDENRCKSIVEIVRANSETLFAQQDFTHNFCHNEIDDPCDTVDILFGHSPNDAVTESNSIDYKKHKLVSLKFHKVSKIVEIVPMSAYICPEVDGGDHILCVLCRDEKQICYRFSMELIGDIASLDYAEDLLEMQSIGRFWINQYQQTERRLMMIEQRVPNNQFKINDTIRLEIISAHGFKADNLQISFQISTSCVWRAISRNADYEDEQTREKDFFNGQTQIASNAFDSTTSLYMIFITFLVGTLLGLYVLAFEIQVIRFSGILFTTMIVSYEAIGLSLPRSIWREKSKATFAHSISLQKIAVESKGNAHDIHNLKILLIVSTYLEDIESIMSFGTLDILPEMNVNEVIVPTSRISSAKGMPKWWLRLHDYFLGSPLSCIRIIQLLLDESNNMTTQSSGVLKLKIHHPQSTDRCINKI